MRKVPIYAVMLLLIANIAAAEVVVFKNYKTNSILGDDMLHIERDIDLQNVGANPIIPGELHFKLHEIKDDKKVGSDISNLGAWNDLNSELKTRIIEGKEETDIVLSIWEPVLPKFMYKAKITYDLKFKPKGLLFHEIKVPVEETTIPIKKNSQSLYLPSGYHVTYAPYATVSKQTKGSEEYTVVTWENREEMVVEYTKLPLPKMGIRAVNVFWIVVIIMLLVVTFFIHRKLRSG